MNKLVALILCCLLLTITGCAANEAQGQGNYEETKKMLVDILKSDKGKDAIKEILADEKLKQEIIMEQEVVKTAIEETLLSKKAEDFWKEALKDPKFAEALAKGIKKEQEKLIKDLMKDPEYQKMLIDVFANPEMEKQMITALKSQEIRKQMSKVMMETFESPLVKGQVADMLNKVILEQLKAEKKEDEKEKK
jgi:spore germination protein D